MHSVNPYHFSFALRRNFELHNDPTLDLSHSLPFTGGDK
jgi:hypothetical protein